MGLKRGRAICAAICCLAVLAGAAAASPELRRRDPSSPRTHFTITEIMYNPATGTNSLEFVEVYNTDPVEQDISLFRISGDVDYTFPSNTIMPARSYLVIASDPTALQSHHGITGVLGPWTNNLSDSGGTVRLRNNLNALLLEVDYNDAIPWPISADGAGHSLVLTAPDYGEDDIRAWSASAYKDGSPGTNDPVVSESLRDIMINEYLSHTDLPQIDYIELFNHGVQSVDITGCTLSDEADTNKFVIPATTMLAPGAFISFDQTELGFSLSMQGDDIYFGSADGTYVAASIRFGAETNGMATGRYPDGSPGFHHLQSNTPGSANDELEIHDIVINEIMYAPVSCKGGEEYVELFNNGGTAIDVGYWRFIDGINYTIPAGTMIPAGGYLVIARDATNLIARYTQLNTGNTVGDFGGSLSDSGERVVLAKPDDHTDILKDPVIIDEVTYGDGDNWGVWADGGGSSLELRDPKSDNRQAMNWAGSDETANATWTDIDYVLSTNGSFGSPGKMDVSEMQEGEFLLDNVEIVADPATVVWSEDFESGLGSWDMEGNHVRSGLDTTSGYLNSQCLHIRASGAGMLEYNNTEMSASGTAPGGTTVRLRAKAKWQGGWPLVIFSFKAKSIEAPIVLDVPQDLGTPGQANGRLVANAGPAISEVTHFPVLPTATDAVVVSCRVQDPDGMSSVSLKYRVDPSSTTNTVAMADNGISPDVVAGDGVFSGSIAAQPAGTMLAFLVEAQDSHASPATTRYPEPTHEGIPARECIVRSGHVIPANDFGVVTFWITNANSNRWRSVLGKYSNEPIGLTMVYRNDRIIYNSTGRYRGGARPYWSPTFQGAYSIGFPKSERFLGDNEMKLDLPGQSQPDTWDPEQMDKTLQKENVCYWLPSQMGFPYSHLRFLRTFWNGTDQGVRHHLQTPSTDFCESWYGDDNPVVYKYAKHDAEALATYKDSGGEWQTHRYRYSLRKKRMGKPSVGHDYTTLIAHADAFAQRLPDYDTYIARFEAVADMDAWMSYYALCGAIRHEDSYGWTTSHNIFFYMPYNRRSCPSLYDMDLALHWDEALYPDAPEPWHITINNEKFKRKWVAYLDEARDAMGGASSYMSKWRSAFSANGISVDSYSGLSSFISGQRSKIQTELDKYANGFSINESDFSQAGNIVTLSGTAQYNISLFTINGAPQRIVRFPINDNIISWQMTFGLHDGVNDLLIEGWDRHGALVKDDTITVTVTAPVPSPAGNLVISEIMYNPAIQSSEFIEIHNTSSTDSFDLRGCRLNGVGFDFEEAGAIIGPGEYRVVAENITSYQYTYGNAEVVIGDYGGNLDNGGETLQLLWPEGGTNTNSWVLVDQVRYDDEAPWPVEADNTGVSLQLLDLTQDNNRMENWDVDTVAFCTPGAANSISSTMPAFPQLWINEVMPSNSAFATDNNSEHEPWIELHNASAGTIDPAGYYLSDDLAQADKWTIPAGYSIAAGGYLRIWVDGEGPAENAAGHLHSSFDLNSASGVVVLAMNYMSSPVIMDYMEYGELGANLSYGAYPEGSEGGRNRTIFHTPTPGAANDILSTLPEIYVNEWMADNESTVLDATDGKFEDWFELYNAETEEVNLGGYTLTDNLSNTNKFTIPWGRVIGPGEHMLVWADGDDDLNTTDVYLHVNFGLGNNGDAVALFAPDGRLVDSVVFGPMTDDESAGRWPDGGGESGMYVPSPGAANAAFAASGLVRMTPTQADVSWHAIAGRAYRVEQCDDIMTTNWVPVGAVTAVSSSCSIEDLTVTNVSSRFYRLIEIK